MTRVIAAPQAERDLDNILRYLEREAGPATALAYAERFQTAIERLFDFPGLGTPRPALGPEARITVVYPYIVIYDFAATTDTVTVLRVMHGKRDITERLIRR